MQVLQTHIQHRRQQGARSLARALAFALLALHTAQLTVPHVANAVQLVMTGNTGDTDADSDEESTPLSKKAGDLQGEAQLLTQGRPRALPAHLHHRHSNAETAARPLHFASLSIPAQAHGGLPHRGAQLVRLTL